MFASDGSTAEVTVTSTSALTDHDTGEGSSGLIPMCGNRVVETGEDCDDGDPDATDGCDDECHTALFVFATDLIAQGDLNGLSGADSLCRTHAMQSAVPGVMQAQQNFIAWMSTSTDPFYSRLGTPKGRYYLPSGKPVAPDHFTLLSGPLLSPISEDMNGKPWNVSGSCDDPGQQTLVWTGTSPGGLWSAYDCDQWKNPMQMATVGDMNSMTPATFTQCPAAVTCTAILRLYCVQTA